MGDLQSGPCRHAGGGVFQRFGAIVARARSSCTRLTLGTSFSQMTFIDHPFGNGNPHAIVSVTQNWNPGGAGGSFNDHPLGVLYNFSASKWAIFYQDIAAMPEGASFNVSIPAVDASTFVQSGHRRELSSRNSTYHRSPDHQRQSLRHPTRDPELDPSGIGGVYNDHLIGALVSYGAKWAIFNQDLAAMPVGVSFNVSIPAIDAATFFHTAVAWNISRQLYRLPPPSHRRQPHAIILVTQSFNLLVASSASTTPSDRRLVHRVIHWSIFNQDGAVMPVGASFNVTVLEFSLYSPTASSRQTSRPGRRSCQ